MVSEYQIEEILYVNPEMIEDGLTIIGRQHQTANGIVDLLAKDKEGNLVIIEVKVNAEHDAVSQIAKYLICFKKDAPDTKIRSILVAQTIPKQVRELCKEFNIKALTLKELKDKPKLTQIEEIFQRIENIEKVIKLRKESKNKPFIEDNLGYLPFDLSMAMRRIISIMVYYRKSFTYAELAEELDVTEGCIRTHLNYLLRKNPTFPLKKADLGNKQISLEITDYNLFDRSKR